MVVTRNVGPLSSSCKSASLQPMHCQSISDPRANSLCFNHLSLPALLQILLHKIFQHQQDDSLLVVLSTGKSLVYWEKSGTNKVSGDIVLWYLKIE